MILAQDGVYDDRGRLDTKRTHFYVPNDYLLQVTGRYPKLMVPCVSINPDRADAVDELEPLRRQRGPRPENPPAHPGR